MSAATTLLRAMQALEPEDSVNIKLIHALAEAFALHCTIGVQRFRNCEPPMKHCLNPIHTFIVISMFLENY